MLRSSNEAHQEKTLVDKRSRRLPPPLHPGGSPNGTGLVDLVNVVVLTCPARSVTTLVPTSGSGVIIGRAEVLYDAVRVPKIVLYVEVASPEDTTAPTGAGIAVLKA